MSHPENIFIAKLRRVFVLAIVRSFRGFFNSAVSGLTVKRRLITASPPAFVVKRPLFAVTARPVL
jgi:hypothetical protein